MEETDALRCRNGKYVKRVPYGQGVIDFAGHLKALKAIGYDGYINLEGHAHDGDLLDGTKGALEYFKNMEKELNI